MSYSIISKFNVLISITLPINLKKADISVFNHFSDILVTKVSPNHNNVINAMEMTQERRLKRTLHMSEHTNVP